MDNLQQLLSQEQALKGQLEVWKEELAQLQRRITDLVCPHKVGDRVTVNKTWGKKEIQTFEITQIGVRAWGNQPTERYYLYGRLIKKDGKPGVRSVSIPNACQPLTQPGELK